MQSCLGRKTHGPGRLLKRAKLGREPIARLGLAAFATGVQSWRVWRCVRRVGICCRLTKEVHATGVLLLRLPQLQVSAASQELPVCYQTWCNVGN